MSLLQIYPTYCTEHTYTQVCTGHINTKMQKKKKKKASIAYLKFTFNWMSNIIVLKLVHYLENSMS